MTKDDLDNMVVSVKIAQTKAGLCPLGNPSLFPSIFFNLIPNEHDRNVFFLFSDWSPSRKCEVSLDYMLPRKSSLSSDSNKTFCLLGHCTGHSEDVTRHGGQYDMGTVLLFNGTKLCV